MPKKRHRESPFNPELVAAITKELPAFLAKEGYLKESTEEKVAEAPVVREVETVRAPESSRTLAPLVHSPVPRGNTKMMWYAVGIFAVAIVAIWGFNLKSIITNVWSERDGQELITQGQDDFKSILETIKENDKIAKEKVAASQAATAAAMTTTTRASTDSAALDALVEAIKAKQNN